MSTVLPILAVIACPLGMAAMGGAAWVAGKLHKRDASESPAGRPETVAR